MSTKLIFFEGLDKVGKTTLMKKFQEVTKHSHVAIDRGPLSSYVYDHLYNRNLFSINEIIDIFNKIKDIVIIVYVECSFDTYEERKINFYKEVPFPHHTKIIFNAALKKLEKHKIKIIRIDNSGEFQKTLLNLLKIFGETINE